MSNRNTFTIKYAFLRHDFLSNLSSVLRPEKGVEARKVFAHINACPRNLKVAARRGRCFPIARECFIKRAQLIHHLIFVRTMKTVITGNRTIRCSHFLHTLTCYRIKQCVKNEVQIYLVLSISAVFT